MTTTTKPEETLCSSKFKIRIYQDLGEGTEPLELPQLTSAVFEYEIDDGSDMFSDEYFPDYPAGKYGDDDEEDDEDMDDEEDEWEGDGDGGEPVFEVTVSYAVTRSVLNEIKGAFPLPLDANLVFEITHLSPDGVPVFLHVFRGWPHHNSSHVASHREPQEMVHSISLKCEDTDMYRML